MNVPRYQKDNNSLTSQNSLDHHDEDIINSVGEKSKCTKTKSQDSESLHESVCSFGTEFCTASSCACSCIDISDSETVTSSFHSTRSLFEEDESCLYSDGVNENKNLNNQIQYNSLPFIKNINKNIPIMSGVNGSPKNKKGIINSLKRGAKLRKPKDNEYYRTDSAEDALSDIPHDDEKNRKSEDDVLSTPNSPPNIKDELVSIKALKVDKAKSSPSLKKKLASFSSVKKKFNAITSPKMSKRVIPVSKPEIKVEPEAVDRRTVVSNTQPSVTLLKSTNLVRDATPNYPGEGEAFKRKLSVPKKTHMEVTTDAGKATVNTDLGKSIMSKYFDSVPSSPTMEIKKKIASPTPLIRTASFNANKMKGLKSPILKTTDPTNNYNAIPSKPEPPLYRAELAYIDRSSTSSSPNSDSSDSSTAGGMYTFNDSESSQESKTNGDSISNATEPKLTSKVHFADSKEKSTPASIADTNIPKIDAENNVKDSMPETPIKLKKTSVEKKDEDALYSALNITSFKPKKFIPASADRPYAEDFRYDSADQITKKNINFFEAEIRRRSLTPGDFKSISRINAESSKKYPSISDRRHSLYSSSDSVDRPIIKEVFNKEKNENIHPIIKEVVKKTDYISDSSDEDVTDDSSQTKGSRSSTDDSFSEHSDKSDEEFKTPFEKRKPSSDEVNKTVWCMEPHHPHHQTSSSSSDEVCCMNTRTLHKMSITLSVKINTLTDLIHYIIF